MQMFGSELQVAQLVRMFEFKQICLFIKLCFWYFTAFLKSKVLKGRPERIHWLQEYFFPVSQAFFLLSFPLDCLSCVYHMLVENEEWVQEGDGLSISDILISVYWLGSKSN